MTDNLTGPELFNAVGSKVADAHETGTDAELARFDLSVASILATQANTAALVMFAGLFAHVHDVRDADLEGWAKVVPPSPRTECWSMQVRRPECIERHTDDCTYTDPAPEPPHELLPVGTRVLVSDWLWDQDDDSIRLQNPKPGRISGYDTHRTKYRWQYEFSPGQYSKADMWAFADNRVEIHPDGPECPPAP